jgi:hypothetical protein
MATHRILSAALGAALLAAAMTGPAMAGTRLEPAFYEGQVVQFLQPAVFSSDRNQGTLACFGLGPDLAGTSRAANTPILYVILNDYATQDHCDGDPTAARHDHVLSAAPGDPGYTGSWTLVFAVPGPNFDPASMPYTSVSQVLAGVASGELVLVSSGVEMIAPVVGGAR